MAATASYVRKLGDAVKKVAGKRGSSWYTPHMAAASRAIMERVPLADLIVEVRDARVPLSSEYHLLRNFPHSLRHIILMNKMDLVSRSQLKAWRTYFEEQNFISYEVNSHNKENVKEFLNFLQARVRELMRTDHVNYHHTVTIMLVGIPNVGKSALANALHQIGRISAAEKGKLKHATVSPLPGETKNISSLKIGSHPNIYVLDTPSVLPSRICDAEVCCKLALTGAINDCCLTGESELAQYFLAIHNLSDEYKKWEKLSSTHHSENLWEGKEETSHDSKLDKRRKATDHTQDFVVHDVRRALFESISSFCGNLEAEKDLAELIDAQLTELQNVFNVLVESDTQVQTKVAAKLLNLYRTGRLGRYTLDCIPRNL